MSKDIRILPKKSYGSDWLPQEFLPAGQDEFYLRNRQLGRKLDEFRALKPEEIQVLLAQGNLCDDWSQVRVAEPFDPRLIRNSRFVGLVRIGKMENLALEHHDLQAPCGIEDSVIIACDLGDHVVVRNVRYLAHYIIGSEVILLNIQEMHATNHAKFGNGIVKEGEPESVRVTLDVINEAGGRAILPFDGMLPADAYIWARYREDAALQSRLRDITQAEFDPRRGYYGTIGDGCVIKNCSILKDVKIGPCAYVKGANKLKNLTINSSEEEPTQIGEGVELVNGIVGRGCHIFYGSKAVRFVMCDNSNLKYGARLIHSVMGENSTVSCCELLHNLLFPAHEQHHNNSFLTAALVLGQSNIAAGATIGSNHNSRSNDGELIAGRGFWPGLCTSLKHSSRFASFALLAKGDYPAELNVPLPFCLVDNDVARDRLTLMPAFWWLYNMYALARNSWKFQSRDARARKIQHIEFDCLAPDTAEEMFAAMRLLEIWTGQAKLRRTRRKMTQDALASIGRDLLIGSPKRLEKLEVLGEGIEHSHRKAIILKPAEGYQAYRRMLHYYAVKNVVSWMADHPSATLSDMAAELAGPRRREWVNLGGQLITEQDAADLLKRIKSGELKTWGQIHSAYDALWQAYPLARQRHAYATLLDLLGCRRLTAAQWQAALDKAAQEQEYIAEQVYVTRKKDYDNPFRQATFRNADEMAAVIGSVEKNSFVKQVREETTRFVKQAEALKQRARKQLQK